MTDDDDALGFVAAMHEESTRQLAQLRVTLAAKIDNAEAVGKSCVAESGQTWYDGASHAYRDVLALLGPEPAWSTDNEAEPF